MSEFIRESDLFLASDLAKISTKGNLRSIQVKARKREREKENRSEDEISFERNKNAHFRRCKERLLEQASDGLMDINMCSCLSKQHFEELETYGYRVTISPFKCPDDLTRYQISWDKHTVNPGSQVSDTNNCSQSD